MIEPSLSTVLQTSPSSRRQIIAKAGRWLKKCQTHENCAKHKSKRLPTRLVSIDRAECGLSAKVVDSSILPSNTEYMTLSHAWGKIPFFTLCKSNLEKCMQSLPMEKLQPVFQDAVMITHDLGFSYIWIDSMCIVQDSEEDWVRESATMHHVYGNSSCNLAATGFADGRTGLLTQSFSDRVLSSKISVTSPIGAWIPRTFRLAQAHPWREQITRNHLSKRGWVLQEQLMVCDGRHIGSERINLLTIRHQELFISL